MSKFISLSYRLNESVQAYGNGKGMEVEILSSMANGQTSNNAKIHLPLHLGTHIDFPFHFGLEGKTSSDYSEQDLIFDKVGICKILQVENYLIEPKHLCLENVSANIEFLIIKTGFGAFRGTEKYWNFGLGIHQDCASFLKTKFPHLKGIGFDLISLNSYQERMHGREAHKAFLLENDILIVEEMDLSGIDESLQIKQLFIVPLWVDQVDGLPVSILAECQ